MKEEYSSYKIVHHQDKIDELKKGVQPTPIQVHIVPSNVCNQNCVFCAYRMTDYLSNQNFDDRSMLKTEKIFETLDCFKNMSVKAVQYTGGGEPLVHKDIKAIFRKTLENGLDLALVSNGQALDTETCQILSDAKWVRISVDCGTRQTYEKIRKVNEKNFGKVINNIKGLVKYKKDGIIGVGYVIEKENYKEILEATKIFKDLGVDNVRLSAAFTPEGFDYFKDFLDEAKQLSEKASELSDSRFTVFNLFNDRVKDTFVGTQDYDFCPIKELQVYIGADYNVYTCCTLAYNDKGLIGSIRDQSFEELWNSKEKMELYKNHNPSKHCKFPCMYRGKNEFINYCVKKGAKHINFI